MSDRTDHYVPQRRSYKKGEPDLVDLTAADAREVVLVEETIPGVGRTLVERRVAPALPDELNRDPVSSWWWADYSDTTEDGGAHWSRFDGHRTLVGVQVHQANSRTVNDWKGRDEVRGRTWATVTFDGQPVWERSGVMPGILLALHRDVQELLALDPLVNHVKKRTRNVLLGRPVYYRDHPGVISRFIGDQGCVIIDADPAPFPQPPWSSVDYDDRESVKVEILSPHIWWWRDTEDGE